MSESTVREAVKHGILDAVSELTNRVIWFFCLIMAVLVGIPALCLACIFFVWAFRQ